MGNLEQIREDNKSCQLLFSGMEEKPKNIYLLKNEKTIIKYFII